MTDDLIAYLRDRLNEREALVLYARASGKDFIVPAGTLLAEVEVRRRILELHQCGGVLEGDGYPEGGFSWCRTCGSGEPNEYPAHWPCATILLLAQPYAGQPGWREEWRP